jgi:hypothetical protein
MYLQSFHAQFQVQDGQYIFLESLDPTGVGVGDPNLASCHWITSFFK